MEPVTLRELLEAVHGRLLTEDGDPDQEIASVSTDSRKITPGCLFIPIVGERYDGHAFITDALEAGAAGCLTARERESYLPGRFYVKVANPLHALWDLARYYRQKFDIPVVAITGSVGKTTTKDMVAATLGMRYRVLKTEGNLNNTIGLPLSVLRLTREHQAAVLELGMSKKGEIDTLSSIARPDIGVITNIGDAHIENLGSREGIFAAKREMLSHLRSPGLVVLNGDDPMLAGLRISCSLPMVFCGTGEGLDYRATEIRGDGRNRLLAKFSTPAGNLDVVIPGLGEYMVYPALIAAAVGERLGLTPEEITQGILRFNPTRMRMNIVPRADHITILDDSYNANPQSMRAAVEVLSNSPAGYRIAVLGDMMELGSFARSLHQSVGEYVGKRKVDCLIAVGELSQYLYESAKKSGVPLSYYCPTKEEAKQVLKMVLQPDCTVLVKASRGMEMEQIVEYLMTITGDPA